MPTNQVDMLVILSSDVEGRQHKTIQPLPVMDWEQKTAPAFSTTSGPRKGGARAHAIFDARKEQVLLIAPVIVNVNSQAINNYTPNHKTH